ncbi:outer membrane protein assembly factor BamE [Pseudoxanthomonas sp. JBR18]|uniref:outer membrane protein assembly factor BamE n=1 Tax=Pseudoxanthomonas sp. JBR18 TaxID=2969308 RepID=UPI0023055A48|nr:outer membrane protein assembly factor BamE [Pseudoxanthomonas sp. JBR18]WCE03658.1 outer membrane protein assembly factor BamE [Pseudoxanthomonas sp. JBR18]
MRKFLLIAALGLATSGCGIIYKQPIYQGNLIDKEDVDQLEVGLSKQQVLALLGTPSVADPFHAQRWDYTSTQRTDRLGHVQMKNFTVFFDNDKVSKWEGDYFPNQDDELARNSVRQFGPNLAKDKKKDHGGG